MKNYIVKTLAYNKRARLLFLDNTHLVKQICQNKQLNPLLMKLLGKTLTVVSLISGTLKGNQRISLQIQASNSKYKIFADADAKGNVRGYVNDELLNTPDEYLNHMTIKGLIGDKGTIQFTKDLGMNQLFTGITDMPHRNITDDIIHYFHQSEQIPTYISVNLKLDKKDQILSSNGIFVQLLPGASQHLLDHAKKVINGYAVTKNHNRNPDELLKQFDDVEMIGTHTIQRFCGCSKSMFYGILSSLSKKELQDAIQQNNLVETVCNICGEKYNFSEMEIESILKSKH